MNLYNGIRYSLKYYNCFDHVVSVRAAAGLSTPELARPMKISDTAKILVTAMKSGEWVKVDEPSNFDVVVIASGFGHVGVFVDGYISHCGVCTKEAITEPASNILAAKEYWRPAQ